MGTFGIFTTFAFFTDFAVTIFLLTFADEVVTSVLPPSGLEERAADLSGIDSLLGGPILKEKAIYNIFIERYWELRTLAAPADLSVSPKRAFGAIKDLFLNPHPIGELCAVLSPCRHWHLRVPRLLVLLIPAPLSVSALAILLLSTRFRLARISLGHKKVQVRPPLQ